MTGWQLGAAATIAGGLALVAAGMVVQHHLEARDASERAMRTILACLEPWPEVGPGSSADLLELYGLHLERCTLDVARDCWRAAELGRAVKACDWAGRL